MGCLSNFRFHASFTGIGQAGGVSLNNIDTNNTNTITVTHTNAANNNIDQAPSGSGVALPAPSTSNIPIPTAVASTSSTSLHPPPNKVQRMVSSYLKKPLKSNERNKIDKCLLNMITKDLQPFSIVEDEGFKEFTRALNPSYDLPSRKTLSDRLLQSEYDVKLASTKEVVMNNCDTICLTVDCWTSRTMTAYIAITGHFIHRENLEFNSFLLQCSALEGSHTGLNIAQELKRIADEWSLTNKVNFIVTDNASNMLSAANILGWEHFGCYVHKLNLIVQEGLKM